MTRSDRPTLPCDATPIVGDAETQLDVVPTLPELTAEQLIDPAGVPWVMVSFSELKDLPLDHRAGFVLSLIDGRVHVEAVVDMSGLPRDEVLAILSDLVARGVVAIR